MKDELYLIDTNILVYSFDASEPDKQMICASLIKKCWMREVSYAISLQNLSEFYVTVTRKIESPLPAEIAKKIISDIINFNSWKVIKFDDKTIMTGINICMKYNIHYWDALLCATMKHNGITNIITENIKDFVKVPWIEVVNPMPF
ncbi:MAG: PIN domain-containing protein [Candidatus Methanoperedens sp.]|nr:PIN domain-containing protein [Candidatus Methanoperedens sp.]